MRVIAIVARVVALHGIAWAENDLCQGTVLRLAGGVYLQLRAINTEALVARSWVIGSGLQHK